MAARPPCGDYVVTRESMSFDRRRRYLSGGRTIIFSLALAAALGLVLLPLFPNYYELHVGDAAPRTFRAPRDVSFESSVLTDQLRDRAAASVPDVLSFDPNIRLQQLARFDPLVA